MKNPFSNARKGVRLFSTIALAGFLAYLIVVVTLAIVSSATGNRTFIEVFSSTSPFGDFAETLAYAYVPNPYSGAYGDIRTMYPPFSIVILKPFALICSSDIAAYVAAPAADKAAALSVLAGRPLFILSFVIFYLVNIAIIVYCAFRLSKMKGSELALFLATVFLFGPFLFEFIRGNNTMLVGTFAVLFFYLYSKEKRVWKELALVALACAAATKIFPLFMVGYVFYKEKGLHKLWAFLRVIAYTGIVVFLPYVFIEGMFSNISLTWENFKGFNSSGLAVADALPPYAWLSNVSMRTVVYYLFYPLHGLNSGIVTAIEGKLALVLRFVVVLLAFGLPFFAKEGTRKKEMVLLAVSAYLLFPETCNGYCLIVLVAPFVATILEWDSLSKNDKIFYGICYGVIACPFLYTYVNYLPQALAVVVMVTKSSVDIIKDFVERVKEKKTKQVVKSSVESEA